MPVDVLLHEIGGAVVVIIDRHIRRPVHNVWHQNGVIICHVDLVADEGLDIQMAVSIGRYVEVRRLEGTQE